MNPSLCCWHPCGMYSVHACVAKCFTLAEALESETMQAAWMRVMRRSAYRPLHFSASSARSEDMHAALSRLCYTIKKGQELPCCLAGVKLSTAHVPDYT